MKKMAALLFASALAAPGMAAASATEGDSFRLVTGYNINALVFEDDFGDEYAEVSSEMPFAATYQSSTGFFGGLSYTRGTIEEVEIEGETFDVDEDYSTIGYTLGYRTSLSGWNDGNYIGAAYTRVDNDDFDDSSDIISVFSQKDNKDRFGTIALSYQTTDFVDVFQLSGKHLWFFNYNFGVGVNWSLGTGDVDLGPAGDADAGTSSFGFSVMLRGDL